MVESVSSVHHLVDEISKLPESWHMAGTVSNKTLQAIAKHTEGRNIAYSMETGSGKTTLLFSQVSQNHKVFAVDGGNKSIEAVRSSPLFKPNTVEFIEGPTQATLPKYQFSHKLQLAFIDGPHGYPFPDLEYYYIYPNLEEGGLLIVDDIQIPTIKKLVEFLAEDDMFTLLEIVDQTAFFQRTHAEVFDPFGDGWWLQQYNNKPLTPTEPVAAEEPNNHTSSPETVAELAELQRRLEKTQAQLKQTRLQLNEAQQRIVAMESSKFWKLRKSWFGLKRALGSTEEP